MKTVDLGETKLPDLSFEEILDKYRTEGQELYNPMIVGGTVSDPEINCGSGNSVFKVDKKYGIWLGNTDWASAPFRVDMDGAGHFEGSLEAGSIHIPNQTTANSFHTETDGDSYWGCNVADWASDNDNASAYILKTGNATFQNITARGLIKTAVFQKDIISAMGGNFIVLGADVLDADMDATDAETLTTKGTTTFAVNDILRIKDGTNDEFMKVTAVNGNVYTVERDKASAYAVNTNPTWKKGATVVNYGQSGDGGIYMTASESNAPYLSVFTHSGNPWTDLVTRLRIGKLDGYLGYPVDGNKFGIGIGDSTHFLKYDPTNHLRITGNITSSTITGGTIQTDSAANTGVKMTNGGLDIYSNTLNFKLGASLVGGVYAGDGGMFYTSDDAITLNADGSIILNASSNLTLGKSGMSGYIKAYSYIYPNANNTHELGLSSYKWKKIWGVDLDIDGTAQVDALRIDQTPTAEVNTATHYATVNFNGTNYKVLLKSI